MDKLIVLVLLGIMGIGPIVTAPPQTPTAQPNVAQSARLISLRYTWEQRQKDADSARDKYIIELYSTLAELGLKPSETRVSWNEKGEPVFSRVEKPAEKENKP